MESKIPCMLGNFTIPQPFDCNLYPSRMLLRIYGHSVDMILKDPSWRSHSTRRPHEGVKKKGMDAHNGTQMLGWMKWEVPRSFPFSLKSLDSSLYDTLKITCLNLNLPLLSHYYWSDTRCLSYKTKSKWVLKYYIIKISLWYLWTSIGHSKMHTNIRVLYFQ